MDSSNTVKKQEFKEINEDYLPYKSYVALIWFCQSIVNVVFSKVFRELDQRIPEKKRNPQEFNWLIDFHIHHSKRKNKIVKKNEALNMPTSIYATYRRIGKKKKSLMRTSKTSTPKTWMNCQKVQCQSWKIHSNFKLQTTIYSTHRVFGIIAFWYHFHWWWTLPSVWSMIL